jgi:hypothetical protein
MLIPSLISSAARATVSVPVTAVTVESLSRLPDFNDFSSSAVALLLPNELPSSSTALDPADVQ